MRLIGALRAFLDPRGPLGGVVSPSITFKERQGVPISAPHTARARMEAPAHVEHTLAAPRFVAVGDAHIVPADRVLQVGAYIEEVWAPVYRRTASTDYVEILLASQDQIGWQVTQRESQASRLARRARLNAEDFIEVTQTCQIQASDEWANGLIMTVPGNDPIVLDGQLLKGEASYYRNPDGTRGAMYHDGTVTGTVITKGRKEYAQRTKGFSHWDAGFVRERAAAEAEMRSRPVRNVKAAMEAKMGEVLPMHRILANPRVDRHSAV